MIRPVAVAALLLSLFAGGAVAAGGDGYAVHLPVAPAPGGGVQRIMLPAAVLVALRRRDGADVRVFDATGRAMPIAGAPPSRAPGRIVRLAPLPILGAAGSMTVTGMSLKLDDAGTARVTRIDGRPAASGTTLLGVLLDTRRIAGATTRLLIDADIPASQPVALQVDASDDLENWSPIARRTVYRTAGGGVAAEAIALDGATLKGRWLRIGWTAGTRLLSPVAITGAAVELADGGGPAPFVVEVDPPAHADPRVIDFALPFRAPIVAIGVRPAARAAIVPFRVLARTARDRPWTLFGAATASATAAADVAATPPGDGIIRVEADPRGDTLAPGTRIRLSLAPMAIAFVAGGTPPFTLAAGREDAADAFLPLSSLVSATRGTDATRLPLATVPDAPVPPLQLADDAGDGRRTLILWAILVGATLLLGGLVWRLAKARAE